MKINFNDKDWAYLLGVIHGDGHIAKRSIEISVGHNAEFYKDELVSLLIKLKLNPKIYKAKSAIRININNVELTSYIRKYKNDGVWTFPCRIDKRSYLAGLFDTDGCVSNTFSTNRKMAIMIVLKRNGNLSTIGQYLTQIGLRDIHVINGNSRYKDKLYPIESIQITGMDRIKIFYDEIKLRHRLKVQKLKSIIDLISSIESNKSTSTLVVEYLTPQSHSIPEIMQHFNLSKRQVESIMQNIKRQYNIEVIAPIPTYTNYKIIT